MRPFNASAALVALACALFVCCFSAVGGQLAAYSETRSFRDALEGRSMEDAISGPVDKDTSSYGERTSEPPSSPAPPAQAGYGPSGSGRAAGGQMMVNIPANGNLNPQVQQQQVPGDDQQQQKSSDGGELEREAGPINPDYPVDNGQQMMEQQMKAKQMTALMSRLGGRSGRLTGSQASMMEMMKQQKAMARMQMSARRLQQQQQQDPSEGGDQYESTVNPMEGGQKMGSASPAPGGYGKKMPRANEGASSYDESTTSGQMPTSLSPMSPMSPTGGYGANEADQQQQMAGANGGRKMDKGYDEEENGAEGGSGEEGGQENEQPEQEYQQQLMAKLQQLMGRQAGQDKMQQMRAKYAKMMMTSGAGMGGQYGASGSSGMYGGAGKRQASSMAQSMMMSLANKAAYMANQKSQQQRMPQRQLAPPPMMMSAQGNGYGGAQMGASGYGDASPAQPMSMSMAIPVQMPRRANYQSTSGMSMGAMRAMRRANQRKAEKKVSPAMMNAMLNRMLGAGRSQQMMSPAAAQQMGYGNGGGNKYGVQMQSAAQMKRPRSMQADAQIMMMTDNNKRNMYKQMGMSAMQQQQMDNDQSAYSDGQQMVPMGKQGPSGNSGAANYGDRNGMGGGQQMMMAQPMTGNGAKSYGRSGAGMPGSSTPSSYGSSSSTMATPAMQYGDNSMMGPRQPEQTGYDGQQQQKSDMVPGQQQMQQQMGGGGDYSMEPAAEGAAKGMQAQQASKSYGGGQSPMMSSMRIMPKMSYGQSAQSGAESGPMKPMYGGGNASKQSMQKMMMMMMMMKAKQQQQQQQQDAYGSGEMMMSQKPQQQMQEMPEGGLMGKTKPPTMMMNGGARGGAAGYQMPGSDQEEEANQQEQQQQQEPGQSGTKSAQSTQEAGSKGSGGQMMKRPSMSMSYGQPQQAEGDQQQQQQQSEEDGNEGAAPMGQAEPFAFDYKVEDEATGNNHYRKEESDKNGVVRGSYGYMDSNSGVYRHVEYVADENGFRANIKSNEPGLSDGKQKEGAGSGGEGTKSGGDGYRPPQQQQPSAGAAPPSSSSSLGGSGGSLMQQQQDTQLPMTPLMGQQQGQEQQRQMSAYPGQQQGGGELESKSK